ncbi:MAG: HAMP domain-containing histidine kinase [Chloroflexi bacterium]|nr:HAMP domain-containing histidine kinase [Chloroflexota bacterium]
MHAPAEPRETADALAPAGRLLITLRWAAGLSILLATAVARWALGIELPAGALLATGAAVLAYNVALAVEARRPDRAAASVARALWSQIALDWLAMTAVVHFTGGIASPALIYFIIHVALAATVLPPRQARVMALLSAVIVAGLAALEATGALPHVTLPDIGLGGDLYQNGTYLLAALFFFTTTALTLSELVSRQAEDLRRREARIRALNEERAAFTRAATHELRAPVAASLALVRSIEQGYVDDDLSPMQSVIIQRVSERLDGLRELIDDLLDFAASREVSLAAQPPEPVDLGAALDVAIDRERPIAEEKDVALHTSDCPAVTVLAGDPGLSMVLGNLLNNAIKYTPAGGDVTVQVAVDQPSGQATVVVRDTGIGIPADELPRIFDEFYRASNAKSARIVGTGIGLAAVRAMVEHYQGTIALNSVEGQGTTVTVRLPLASTKQP